MMKSFCTFSVHADMKQMKVTNLKSLDVELDSVEDVIPE